MEQGEYGRAAALLTESLALARQLGNTYGSAIALTTWGLWRWSRGTHSGDGAAKRGGLALCRSWGTSAASPIALSNLGWVALEQDKYGRAGALFTEPALRRELGGKGAVGRRIVA